MNLEQIKKEAKEFVSAEALKKYNSAINSFEKENALTEFRARLKSITDPMKRNLIAGHVAKEVGMKKEDLMPIKRKAPVDSKVYIQDGCYVASRKGGDKTISNFILEPNQHIIGNFENGRLFNIIPHSGQIQPLIFPSETLTNLSAFKTKVFSAGPYHFSGTSEELEDLIGQWIDQFKSSIKPDHYGWSEELNAYIFSDAAIINGEVCKASKSGVIEHPDGNISVSAKANSQLDNMYKRNMYSPGSISLSEWTRLYHGAYGSNGIIGICFNTLAAFRDVVQGLMDAMPIFMSIGPKGSGKSSLARSTQCLFQNFRNGINSDSSTGNGMIRIMASASNQAIWLDEIDDNTTHSKIQVFKDFYDGAGKIRANKTNDYSVNVIPIRGSAIFTGQYLPEGNDNAFYERCIECRNEKGAFSELNRKHFSELKEKEKEGLHLALEELLSFRKEFKGSISTYFLQASEYIRSEFGDIKERFINNFGILLSAGYFLIDNGVLKISPAKLEEAVKDHLQSQLKRMNQTSYSQKIMNAIRWAIETEKVQFAYSETTAGEVSVFDGQRSVPAYQHHGIEKDYPLLFIRTSRFKDHIQNYLAREGNEVIKVSNILTAIKEHEYWMGSVKRFQLYSQGVPGYILDRRLMEE